MEAVRRTALSRVKEAAPCHRARRCGANCAVRRPGTRRGCLGPWPGLLRHLRALGRVEVTDALRRGLITKVEADALLG
jgi:hypothetical protein